MPRILCKSSALVFTRAIHSAIAGALPTANKGGAQA
jgi:hypothetical protein